MSEYEIERNRIIGSFNTLMNAISRTNNVALKKQALKFSNNFEYFMKFSAELDQVIAEKDILSDKYDKLELLLSLFLPFNTHETISESDILEMKRLQLDNYYAVRSFIEDASLVSEVGMFKRLGFRFKKGLNREQLQLKLDDCRKKLINKYADSQEQPSGIN